jgi:hypothetical protein
VKKILMLLGSAVTTLVMTAAPALAEYPPSGTNNPPKVLPTTLHAPQGLAFTGGQVVPLVIAAVTLFALGLAFFAFARRVRGGATS